MTPPMPCRPRSIAEDEPLLAATLQSRAHARLARAAHRRRAGDGEAAVELALELRPDVLFLDIRMPGMTGLEAAEAIAEDWPDGVPAPLVVFVTAYDRYALEAFEHAAVDYVLKPVEPDRLARTAARLQALLQERRGAAGALPERATAPWRDLLASGRAARPAAGAPRRHPGGERQRDPSRAGARGGRISKRPTSTCAC